MQGTPLLVAGKWEEAAKVFRQGVDLMRRAGAEDANLLRGLTTAYRGQGKYAEAEPYMVDLVALERRAPGDGDRQTRADMGGLAQVYIQQSKYAEAEKVFLEVQEAQRKYVGVEALNTLISLSNIGWLRLQQHKLEEAESALRSATAALDRTVPDAWERYAAQGILGAVLASQRKYEEAEKMLLSAYNGMAPRQPTPGAGGSFFPLSQVKEALARLYQDLGDPARAAEWRAR